MISPISTFQSSSSGPPPPPVISRSHPHISKLTGLPCRCLDQYLRQSFDLPEHCFPCDDATALRLIRQAYPLTLTTHPKTLFNQLKLVSSTSNAKIYVTTTKCGFSVVIKKLVVFSNSSLQAYVDLEVALSFLSTDCPQILDYYFSARTLHNVWIVMENMTFGSIANIRARCFMDEYVIAYVIKQVLIGLRYLHKRYRMHRDIKAQNILVNGEGYIKIADFGWASQLTATTSTAKMHVGSLFWMAPEVQIPTSYSLPADIWSVGILAIELACQNPPLRHIRTENELRWAVISGQPPELRNFPPPEYPNTKWSDMFVSFTHMCLKYKPAERLTVELLLEHSFIQNSLTPGQWCTWLRSNQDRLSRLE